MKKNDIFRTKITDLSINGEGIGRFGGMPFFVAGAIIGDEITASVTKLKKTYGYARIISIDVPSSDRVMPACFVAEKCGGCSIMSMSYPAQLKWKEDFVENALARITKVSSEGILRAKRPAVGMDDPYHFRNKSQYPVGADGDGNIIAGFYAPHSHRIIPIVGIDPQKDFSKTECMIAPKDDKKILSAVISYMKNENVKPYDEKTGKGLVRHVLIRHGFSTGEIMVCLVINGDELPKESELINELLGTDGITSVVINKNKRRDNVILGEKTRTLFGKEYIEDILLNNRFRISARSFFQVNPIQTQKLYNKAIEYACLNGNEIVWDLYCGIGTISLSVAGKCSKVIGIETVSDAIRDAKENAKINGIENAYFVCGKAEDILYNAENDAPFNEDPDVIIVDPPRKGLDPVVVDAIIKRSPKRIVYVSCNPSTLARDLAPVLSAGYSLKEYTPFDQFCHSSHVESCVLLERVSNRKADSYVKLNVKMEDYYRIKDAESGETNG